MVKDKIYQSFVLDRNTQERVDRLESKARSQESGIDSERGEKLINSLKKRYVVILVSNSVYAGVYTDITVGSDSEGIEDIKKDFKEITEELGLYFMIGASLTEIL